MYYEVFFFKCIFLCFKRGCLWYADSCICWDICFWMLKYLHVSVPELLLPNICSSPGYSSSLLFSINMFLLSEEYVGFFQIPRMNVINMSTSTFSGLIIWVVSVWTQPNMSFAVERFSSCSCEVACPRNLSNTSVITPEVLVVYKYIPFPRSKRN